MARKKRWTLARGLTLFLAIIPVGVFALIIGNLVWNSLPALTKIGLPVLFSTKLSNVFSGVYTPGEFGLLPAIWGTILLAVIILLIALPVSLSIAIFATEFSLRGIGRISETCLALFSGIPPIIYGVLSVYVVSAFIRPKFTGQGLTDDFIKSLPGLPVINAGMLPRELSTLLGGIMLTLLVIPFMTPLLIDAIKNVPFSLKEASMALGATRWYTMRKVILPYAQPGIVSAASLATLKIIGDVVIVAWTIGYVKSGMPVPLWDVFEPIAPLTSTGAGLLSGLRPGAEAAAGPERAVAYFTALLLLIMALAILGLSSLIKSYLRRRFAQ